MVLSASSLGVRSLGDADPSGESCTVLFLTNVGDTGNVGRTGSPILQASPITNIVTRIMARNHYFT
jgi:hypothetical protein